MIVIDASVLADAVVDDGPVGDAARAVLASDSHWAAPAHLLVEVMSVIRGKSLAGKLRPARAEEAVAALPTLVIDYVDAEQLVGRMWQLRGNVTAYDAAYVATAEFLGCTLVTGDSRLAKSNAVRCDITLVGDST